MTARDVAELLWLALGQPDDEPLNAVEITGPAVVLPSLYRVTDVAAASVMAATAAALRLSERPSLRPSLTTTGAAAVFRSERHIMVQGRRPALWEPMSGYYQCADGRWIQLHCNFPHHRAGVVDVLGCPDDPAAVADVLRAEVRASELEDRLAVAGLCATMARTPEEWAAHAQGQAVATLPVIEIDRAGAAPPRGLTSPPDLPLAGVRVLDLTRIIAGPTCGRVLGQYGAQVLRIGAHHLPTVEACVIDTGFGKRAAHLDLRSSQDRAVMEELLSDAHVVIDGFRPGGLDSLGYGGERLLTDHPGLVHVTLSAYGHLGPWSTRRGFDSLTQTASGIGLAAARAAGVEGTLPLPCQALDHGTGWLLAAATMTALHRQREEGGSWMIRGSLAQTGHFLTSLGQVDHLDHPEPTDSEVAPYLTRSSSSFGELTHVAAQGRLDGRVSYDLPPVPVGTHPPAWWRQ